MKRTHIILLAAAASSSILLESCGAMLDTSLDMSPAPGVGVSVGVSTPITGWWGDGSYYPPYWGGSVYGPPAWGIGAPTAVPSRPHRPVWRPNYRPGENRPVIRPSDIPRPYPTGPGPVIGGTGLPVLHPGQAVNPEGTGRRPGGGFRPGR